MATTLLDQSGLAAIRVDTGARIAQRSVTPFRSHTPPSRSSVENRVRKASETAAEELQRYENERVTGRPLRPTSRDEKRAFDAGFEAGLADCKSGVAGGRKTRRRRQTRRRGARSSRRRPTRST